MPELTSLPSPRTPDPMSAPPLRWGILAPGGIADSFVRALHARTRQQVAAVGSRELARAQNFAATHGIPTAHGSYADLVADPSVEIVYVASPMSGHHEHAMLALDAGKHVLVEKSFTCTAAEAREVVETARSRGLFCMEAMWTRFLPGIDVVRQCLEEGLLGEIDSVHADHGQPLYPNGPQRLSDPLLGGGALLDLGIYPMSFAHLVLGGFDTVRATGTLTPEGVDACEAITVTGARGGLGVLHATMLARTACVASVVGTQGRLDLGERDRWLERWYAPTAIRHTERDTAQALLWEPEEREHGLHFQAAEAARCITDGLIESPLLPTQHTVDIMVSLDTVRRQLGVIYPGE